MRCDGFCSFAKSTPNHPSFSCDSKTLGGMVCLNTVADGQKMYNKNKDKECFLGRCTRKLPINPKS